ncbi:MAG: fumarate hydratase [Methylophilaceae bacterium]
MKVIKQEDFIESIASALQYISYYHSEDFILALTKAYEIEESEPAKDAMLQILSSSKLSAFGKRPLCQDTGIVIAFIKVGMNVRWDTNQGVEEMVNAGVSRAYLNESNILRASIVKNPLSNRINTKDNTPAITHISLVQGDGVEINIAAKGAGSENKAQLSMMNPSDSLVDYVLDLIPKMGAGWCPPGVLGIGVGGTAEKAVLLAKESLFEPINIHELIKVGPSNRTDELRLELYNKINKLGIGAQGLGGLTTVLDVKIKDYPTHAASLPVAVIPNCAANRHVHFKLDGKGPVQFKIPNLDLWPKVCWSPKENVTRVNINNIKKSDIANWKTGQSLLLSGKILTARDGAHKKLSALIKNKEPLPKGLNLKNRFIYYVGPVSPVAGEVVGPAGPTTADRMDRYTELMLGHFGILGMIGKAERGEETIQLIKKYQATYLIAVGGSAFLVSQAIKSSKVVAFSEMGMEAIYEFEVIDMPVTVAVDPKGRSIHQLGVRKWKEILVNR